MTSAFCGRRAGLKPARVLTAFLLFVLLSFHKSLATAQTNTPVIRTVRPGELEIGGVSVIQSNRTLSFPAVVNMRSGIVEYALVSQIGKLHESIFSTSVDPQNIQLAALLLGIHDREHVPANPKLPLALQGDEIRISVAWNVDGTTRTAPIEEFIRLATTKRLASAGPWIYNGSEIRNGRFIAQRDGSIISIHDDLEALVNNPRPGRENDDLWRVNEDLTPAKDTAVRILFQCIEPSKQQP